MIRYTALVLAIISFSFTPAQEPETPNQQKAKRYIVGFAPVNFDNAPKDLTINRLKGNDKLSGILGRYTLDGSENLNEILIARETSEDFFDKLKTVESKIHPWDELIIYVSSQGFEYLAKKSSYRYGDDNQGNNLYIVTNEIMKNWIPMIELTKFLARTKLKGPKKFVIINCSRKYINPNKEEDNKNKWINSDALKETDADGRILISEESTAIEAGKIDIDLNLAILFACSSGLDTNKIKIDSQTQGQEAETYGAFEIALYKVPKNDNVSIENIFDYVRKKTDYFAINLNCKPQMPTLLIYSDDPASYLKISKQWNLISKKKEPPDIFQEPLKMNSNIDIDTKLKQFNNLDRLTQYRDNLKKEQPHRQNINLDVPRMPPALIVAGREGLREIPGPAGPIVRQLVRNGAEKIKKENDARQKKLQEEAKNKFREECIKMPEKFKDHFKDYINNKTSFSRLMPDLLKLLKQSDLETLIEENKKLRSELSK